MGNIVRFFAGGCVVGAGSVLTYFGSVWLYASWQKARGWH